MDKGSKVEFRKNVRKPPFGLPREAELTVIQSGSQESGKVCVRVGSIAAKNLIGAYWISSGLLKTSS